MKEEQHKIEVEKLAKIESELTELMFDQNNDTLNDKFLDWQTQRSVCNEGWGSWVLDQIKEIKEKPSQVPYIWTLDDEDSGDLEEVIDEMIAEGQTITNVVPLSYAKPVKGRDLSDLFSALILVKI